MLRNARQIRWIYTLIRILIADVAICRDTTTEFCVVSAALDQVDLVPSGRNDHKAVFFSRAKFT